MTRSSSFVCFPCRSGSAAHRKPRKGQPKAWRATPATSTSDVVRRPLLPKDDDGRSAVKIEAKTDEDDETEGPERACGPAAAALNKRGCFGGRAPPAAARSKDFLRERNREAARRSRQRKKLEQFKDLEARMSMEQKMLDLMRENAQLKEENQWLRQILGSTLEEDGSGGSGSGGGGGGRTGNDDNPKLEDSLECFSDSDGGGGPSRPGGRSGSSPVEVWQSQASQRNPLEVAHDPPHLIYFEGNRRYPGRGNSRKAAKVKSSSALTRGPGGPYSSTATRRSASSSKSVVLDFKQALNPSST